MKVFCKNCKHFSTQGFAERGACNHPSLYVKIDRYNPISGHWVEIVVNPSETDDPYRKNKYCDCPQYEEKFLVKFWNSLKRKLKK